jgi:dethiobiotin synthetase
VRGYFVTATDTDAGKTFVTAALLAGAARRGLRAAGLKPVAAGAEPTAEGLRNGDALTLMGAASAAFPYEQVNPLCLAPPIAPHIAAREAGITLDVAGVLAACRPLLHSDLDLLLVEGAGGWRVPLNATETLADLARALGFPVILVVAMRLGCINHALLSAEAIRADGLTLAGWVANSPVVEMPRYRDNLATLAARLGAPLLGEIPPLPSGDYREAAARLTLPAV